MPSGTRPLHLLLCLPLLLLAASCTRSAEAPRRTLALAPCKLEGLNTPAQCGTLEVWEDRAAKRGRKVPLRVAVVPALAASPEPDPVFLLAGGPGQGAVDLAGTVMPLLERLRRERDLVFVDQRGTGKSRPLDCDTDPPDAGLSARYADTFDPEPLRRCLAGYDADPRLYTTPLAMDDLDEVREALGYARIDLYGVSYGTRAALVYLRQHGEHARAVVLDGVAPMGLLLPLYMARDSQRALDLLFAHCAKDAHCARAYPNLKERFEALLAGLRRTPAKTRVAHPLTGVEEDVTIPFDAFVGGLRGLLYMSEATALVPLVVDRAEKGDWAPFVAVTAGLQDGFAQGLSLGMFFSVVCSEDAPFITEEAIAREGRGTWAGEGFARKLLRGCEVWPRGKVPEDYLKPVSSPVPVLLLSGELDPVTPPSWGEEAARHLPHSLHVTVPGVGHNTLVMGCARSLMADFIVKGSVEGLQPRCDPSLGRPPFFTSFAGPTP
ncbi:alpha/beta hydrolase [Aggregicoccus sp. 17bor-14]|uniref:alpha/beta hydrolase n=1 Tax=Myxococcaceae TaxID=31 RepID=UPI00129CD049|nr:MULTISPECIES: alpha/beta hydrolase [Myxococcaceae]MBF5041509.1 alpha/beta hydrolase [Simulacricoccus sp. 17bor-14]MRI87293.1 alpha/beta hydrolase [Aggregicoccus sp. 17bor-14]